MARSSAWRRLRKGTGRAILRDQRLRPGSSAFPAARHRAGLVFRVIHRDHRATPVGAAPAPSRFSDPQERYAVLYASEAVRCVFWEALGRNRLAHRRRRELPRTEAESRLVVSIRSTETLGLIDLRGDGPVRIGEAARNGNRVPPSNTTGRRPAPPSRRHPPSPLAADPLSDASRPLVCRLSNAVTLRRRTGHVRKYLF